MNKVVKNLTKDSIVYGAGSVLQRGLSFLLLPLFTNYLDTSEYGIVVLTIAISNLLAIFFGMTSKGVIIKKYYDYKNDFQKLKTFISSTFIFTFLFGLIFSIILSTIVGEKIFYSITPNVNFSEYIIPVIWYSYFLTIIQLYQELLRAEQKSKLFVFTQLFTFFISTLLIIYLIIYKKLGVSGQILGSFYAYSIIYFFIMLSVIKKYGLILSKKHIFSGISFSLPIVIHLVAGWAISKIDRILLSRQMGVSEVGIYDLGYKIGMSVYLITSAINFAWAPIFYEEANKKHNDKSIFSKIFNIYLILIGIIVLIISAFSIEIIKFISSDQYVGANKIVLVIAMSYFIQGIYFMLVTPLFYKEKTHKLAIISVFSSIINVILNFLLIGKIGLLGSGISLLISQLFLVVFVHLASQKIYKINYEYRKILLFIVLLLIGLFITTKYTNSNNILQTLIKLIVISIIFLSSFYLKLIKKTDVKEIVLIFFKRKKPHV